MRGEVQRQRLEQLPLAGVHRVHDTYKKERISQDVGGGITVEGEGPFEASLDGETIRIRTSGRKRVLLVTRPPYVLRPQLWVDGQEWMASWTDYPASNWGKFTRTDLIGLSVPEGKHELVIKNMVFPDVWARPFAPVLGQPDAR